MTNFKNENLEKLMRPERVVIVFQNQYYFSKALEYLGPQTINTKSVEQKSQLDDLNEFGFDPSYSVNSNSKKKKDQDESKEKKE